MRKWFNNLPLWQKQEYVSAIGIVVVTIVISTGVLLNNPWIYIPGIIAAIPAILMADVI